jgi:hypothetical protein
VRFAWNRKLEQNWRASGHFLRNPRAPAPGAASGVAVRPPTLSLMVTW